MRDMSDEEAFNEKIAAAQAANYQAAMEAEIENRLKEAVLREVSKLAEQTKDNAIDEVIAQEKERPIKLKIISDGTTAGTQVTDAETGRRLDGVYRIQLTIDAMNSRIAHLTVSMYQPLAEIAGEVTQLPYDPQTVRGHHLTSRTQ